MPHINIFESDHTGAEYTGGETVVFVPGALAIKTGTDKKSLGDDNNCVYIGAADYTSIGNFVDLTTLDSDVKKGTAIFLQACLSHGLDVIYCYVANFGTEVPLGIKTGSQNSTPQEEDKQGLPTIKITLPGKIKEETKGSGEKGNEAPYTHTFGYTANIGFLQDKDTYNVKILTTGCLDAISSITENNAVLQEADDATVVKFDFSAANALCQLAYDRKDSTALLSVGYDTKKVKNGEAFAAQLKAALSGEGKAQHVIPNGGAGLIEDADAKSYGAILFPNLATNSSTIVGGVQVNYPAQMPSVWAYIADYGNCLKDGQEWLPIANSTRGSVAGMGKTNLTVTKYYTDQNIIKDTEGVSFNTIVNIRPYGDVIWGDRTLLELTGSVKATAYLSLRLLICDVAKRAYQAAVRYTYESNNAVTWFNFKSRIVDLLGEMVTSGVLSNYSITKLAGASANTIVCKITLYPNLPVENFDIYINLENAEVTPADSAAGAQA